MTTVKDAEPQEPLVKVEDAKAAAKTVKVTSFKDLLAKRRRKDVVKIPSYDIDGTPTMLEIHIEAIGGVDYDELVAAHKPNAEGRARGDIFNPATFMPALIAACTTSPKLTYADAQELYNSEEWSGGELSSWFIACQRVNNGSVDIPFSANG